MTIYNNVQRAKLIIRNGQVLLDNIPVLLLLWLSLLKTDTRVKPHELQLDVTNRNERPRFNAVKLRFV